MVLSNIYNLHANDQWLITRVRFADENADI